MSEINPENTSVKTSEIVVFDSVTQQSLVKVNRFLLMIVFALTAVVFVLGFWVMPSANDSLTVLKTQAAIENAAKANYNPVLSAEIDTLKGQLFGLLSGSIESKLRVLEDNVKKGRVADSLGTIEDLQSDVRILRSYSEPKAKVQAAVENQRLIEEMSRLKNLVYLTFASCGLMIAAVAGVWLKNRHRIRHQPVYQAFLARQQNK